MRLLTYILVGGGAAIAVVALAVVLLDNGETKSVEPQADAGQAVVTPAPAADDNRADTAADADAETAAAQPAAPEAEADGPAEAGVSIDLAQVTPAGEAVFAGKAAPNAEVTVFEGDVILGTATANADGEWVIVPERALAPGEHLVSVGAKDADGTTTVANVTMAIKVGETEDEQPLVALLPQGETDVPELLQSPDDKPESEMVTSAAPSTQDGADADTDAAELTPAVAPRSLSWKDNGDLVVAGVSRGGARVTATAADKAFGEAAVGDDGAWQIAGRVDISKPRRIMRFTLQDGDGQTIASYRLPVASRDLSQGMDGSKMVIVQQGDALWRIAYQSYGEGIKYVDIVRRNAAAINDPDLIFPNQIFAIPE
ncbi:MAG: Ig-like domain-containing protein [Pseudomonadota bacterium]|nr:Ig-like domain-containing protein [Pseudomonadota bacterium]